VISGKIFMPHRTPPRLIRLRKIQKNLMEQSSFMIDTESLRD